MLVELLVAMVSQRITAEELALLIRLFLEKTPPTVNIKPHQSLSSALLAHIHLVDIDSLQYVHSICKLGFTSRTISHLLVCLPVTLTSQFLVKILLNT